MNLNIAHLRFAAAVAHSGSFSRAAEICNVTQPALSNAIAQLEGMLEGRLFERTTRAVSLTPFGRHMLAQIEGMLAAQDELIASARAFFCPLHKLVRIGLSPLADFALLKNLLDSFSQAEIDTTTLYKECFLENLWERLTTEQIDVAIRPVASDLELSNSLAAVDLYADSLYVLLPNERGNSSGRALTLNDVKDQTFVLTPDLCGLARITKDYFIKAGLSLKAYPGQALSYQVMSEWADLGIGAAILPATKLTADRLGDAHPLVDTDGKALQVRFVALWKRTAEIAPHIRELREHFKRGASSLARAERNAELHVLDKRRIANVSIEG